MDGSWRLTFSLTSLILLVSSIFFMLRGSGAVQIWNDPRFADAELALKNEMSRNSITTPLQPKQRAKSIYAVEQKILKVLHVQEPDRFTRVRAYSTSFPNERREGRRPNLYRPGQKRASIS